MYFEEKGKVNTQQTLDLAFGRAKELGITEAVVATSSGDTAYKALEVFKGFTVTAVTYHCGFRAPFENVMENSVKADLEKKGVKVVQCSHALSGLERSVAKKNGGIYPALLIADTLRLLGQGVKVAVEITVMAADAGALSGKDVVAIGGSAKGADAALILTPAHMTTFFDMKIREVICKPRNF